MDFQAEIQAIAAHSRDLLQCSQATKLYHESLQQYLIHKHEFLRTAKVATASASRMRHTVPSSAHAATPLPSAPSIKKSDQKPKITRRTRKNKILDIIPVNSTIHLKDRADITATVQGDGSIIYDGVAGSLSSTARKAFQSTKPVPLPWEKKSKTNCNGWDYWCYNDTPLTDLDEDFP